MGLSRSWHRFNGAHVDQMGWMQSSPGTVSTVVASGVYDIVPIVTDPATASGPQVLKVEKAVKKVVVTSVVMRQFFIVPGAPRACADFCDPTVVSRFQEKSMDHRNKGPTMSQTLER